MGLFDLFKRKRTAKSSQSEVMVSFEMPKSTHNYNYPWDKRRPSSNSDYSNAHFLCHFKKPHLLSDDPNQFARSVSYSLHIYDPIKRRNELLKKGFLRLSTPEEILSTHKVAELKEILEKNGQPTTGTKAELIPRIITSIDVKRLKLQPMCQLSKKGYDFINKVNDCQDT